MLVAIAGLFPQAPHGRTSSLLSESMPRLADASGGHAGARFLWRFLRRGEDPSALWASSSSMVEEAARIGMSKQHQTFIQTHFRPITEVARLSLETVAPDGTRKLLLCLHDGLEVETVLIPPLPRSGRKVAANSRAHSTLCISSQVGCRQGCLFCATGRMGRLRDLSVDEILAQAFHARRAAALAGIPPLSNIVFMGMGEPADNLVNVHAAIDCLSDPRRFSFAKRAITVSTVAPSPASFAAILRLPHAHVHPHERIARGRAGSAQPHVDDRADETSTLPSSRDEIEQEGLAEPSTELAVTLAWSLHSADPELRRVLVPTATHSPVVLRDALCEALRARAPRLRRLLIEYVMISGVNDDRAAAEELARFLAPLHAACHVASRNSTRTGVLVNLIPYNPSRPSPPLAADASTLLPPPPHSASASPLSRRPIPHPSLFEKPSEQAVLAFQQALRRGGVWTSVRPQRGGEQHAACGQLATSRPRPRQSEREPAAAEVRSAGGDEPPAARRNRNRSARLRMELDDGWEGEGDSEASRLPPIQQLLDELIRELLRSPQPARWRCCTACHGDGVVPRRRRPPSSAHTAACGVCCGCGLVAVEATEGIAHSTASTAQAQLPNVEPRHLDAAASVGGAELVSVAVVGAGIGGLAFALALQQRGVEVAVFERDNSFFERAQGYGLTLQQGWSAVAALGVADAVVAAGSVSTRHVSIDARGNELGRHGVAVSHKGELEPRRPRRRNVHVPRQVLRAILYSRLAAGTVRWGHAFEQASLLSPELVQLTFDKTQPKVVARLVVGADGIHSRVHKVLWEARGRGGSDGGLTNHNGHGEVPLKPLGVMVVLGLARNVHPYFADGETVLEMLDGETRVYAMPFSAAPLRSTMWQLSFPLDLPAAMELARRGGNVLLAEARRRCAAWAAPLPQLLSQTAACDVSGYPIFDRYAEDAADHFTPEAGPFAGVATLLGDSAHPMAPFKAQGANQALLDAVSLASAVYDSSFGDAAAEANLARATAAELSIRQPRRRRRQPVQQALRQYERQSAMRVAAKVKASREASFLLHSPFALEQVSAPLTRAAAARLALERQQQRQDNNNEKH